MFKVLSHELGRYENPLFRQWKPTAGADFPCIVLSDNVTQPKGAGKTVRGSQ